MDRSVSEAEHTALEKRIVELEFARREIEGRLSRGAATFEKLRERTEPQALAKWLPWIVGLAISCGGFLWTFAHYPSSEEIDKRISVQSPYVQDRARVLDAVAGYEALRNTITQIQVRQAETNAKIDQVLERLGDKAKR